LPRFRRLSGREVIRILETFGFVAISQRGSHVKLRRMAGGERQTLHVPAHDELDTGTAERSSARRRVTSRSELLPHFIAD